MWRDIPGTQSDWVETIGGIMSTETEPPETTGGIKARRPWLVGLLSVVTLGIYSLVWYYRINREMRDLGRSGGQHELAASKPLKSLLAVTIGGLLVVPPIISYLHTITRVQTVERISTGSSRSVTALRTILVGSVTASLGGSIRGAGPGLALGSLAALSAGAAVIQARLNAALQARRVDAVTVAGGPVRA
jgi:hypothetical protein